jgi:hypothetical protein
VPPGESDGVGRDVDRGHARRPPDESREGLAVPAAEFQDGGMSRKVRERRRRSAPEVSPPPVVVIPGRRMGSHASEVGAGGG